MSTESAHRTLVMAATADLPPRLLERRGGAILVVLVLTGGAVVLPGLGWIVGVALLWSSYSWNRRDKAIGALVGPVAVGLLWIARLLFPVDIVNAPSDSCSSGGFCAPQTSSSWYLDASTVAGVLVVVNMALAIYLLVRFRPGALPRHRTAGTAAGTDRSA